MPFARSSISPESPYQSNFTPTRTIRGETMLTGRRKDDPDDQIVF
jgi:hypothetical protein